VRCLAFQAKDGELIAELLNSAKQPAAVSLSWHGKAVKMDLPALSITTCLWKVT